MKEGRITLFVIFTFVAGLLLGAYCVLEFNRQQLEKAIQANCIVVKSGESYKVYDLRARP